jgi:hypothetical protein
MSRVRGIGITERLGRWSVTGHAPDAPGVQRVRVRADDGTEADAWVLGPPATRAERQAFAERHRALARLDPAGLVDTLDVFDDGDHTVVVRAPLEDATLAQVDVPLPGDQVAAVGVRLFQAVREAGSTLQGALQPHDIGLDAEGRPVLAPVGRAADALPREALGYAAPEAFGGEVGPEAALYGLGAVLYWLATGQAPSGGARADRPPPVPASSLRHGLPEALDEGLALLLSHDADERAAALPLLQQASGPLPDLRPKARPTRVGQVRYTTRTEATTAGRADDDPGAFVLLAADTFSGLDAAQRSRVAGEADAALSALDALAREGLPIVLATTAGAGAARARAEELGSLPVQTVSGGSVPLAVPIVASLALAAVPAGIGALSLLLTWWLSLVLFVIAGVIAVAGGAAALWMRAGRTARTSALAAHRKLQEHRRQRSAGGRLDAAWGRAASLRRQLAAQRHLPEPAEADLRDALRDIEERLSELAEGAVAAGEALSKVDAAGLRTRMEALSLRAADDDAARAERDRLRATLADLDAVEAQRDALLAEVRELDSQLDRIAAAVGRAASDAPDGLGALAEQSVSRREAARRAQRARQGQGT